MRDLHVTNKMPLIVTHYHRSYCFEATLDVTKYAKQCNNSLKDFAHKSMSIHYPIVKVASYVASDIVYMEIYRFHIHVE